MRLSAGDKLGHYHIVEQIGAGGMGVVYRARDSRVGRDVAIKVSSERFTSRFEREARAVAALNHPNICTLYDVGPDYLVMELIDGEPPRGPLPIQTALGYARQIADALDAAHEKGIVHRDLKPANIRVRSDGTVKVLDFGLAKVDAAGTDADAAANSPTMSMAGTQAGMILGTAAYMAPEQARGKPVDKRADIWAFGVVLYEMLTGRQAFDGDDVSTIIAAVIHSEPGWEGVPDHVRPLLESCLEKDPRKRLRDIGDAWRLLDDARQPATSSVRFPQAGWKAAGALALAAAVAVWAPWRTAPSTAASPPFTLDIDLGEGVSIQPMVAPTFSSLIISPDGTRVVFVGSVAGGSPRLFARRLDESRLTELAGTQGALSPFFSIDGEWVAFWRNSTLAKVPVDGGAVVPVADLDVMTGGHWADDGHFVVGSGSPNTTGIVRIPPGGGATSSLVELAPGEMFQSFPQLLPGRNALLMAVVGTPPGVETTSVEVVTLEDSRRKALVRAATSPRYLPSGHLIYATRVGMFAVPFDIDTLETRGAAVAILSDAAFDPMTGAAQYDISRGGALVYRKNAGGNASMPMRVQWLDQSGRQQPLLGTPGSYRGAPRLSPDGRRVAVAMRDGADLDIFVFDRTREVTTRLTSGGGMFESPVWTASGRHVIFASRGVGMFWTRADGSGPAQPLLHGGFRVPVSVTKDGTRLAFLAIDGMPQIWSVPLEEGEAGLKVGTPERLLTTQFTDGAPAFSPDSRWVAYQSNRSGRTEVYVLPFPVSSGEDSGAPISSGGGAVPGWLPNGRELVYLAGGRIMTVSYTTNGRTFVADKPRVWSDVDVSGATGFDVASDGRLAITVPAAAREARRPEHTIGFVLNFFDELRMRAPGGR